MLSLFLVLSIFAAPAMESPDNGSLTVDPPLPKTKDDDPGSARPVNPPSWMQRILDLDRNGDGVLTPKEFGRPLFFRWLDGDGDGKVTRRELEVLAQVLADGKETSGEGGRVKSSSGEEGNRKRARSEGQMDPPDEPGRVLVPGQGADDSGPDRVSGKAAKTAVKPGTMEKRLDISYAVMEGVDPKRLSLDLYLPPGEGPFPVLVMIHGGGWRMGDKGHRGVAKLKSRYFTEKGFVFASVNYRLSPKVKHPVHVRDVARALAWIHDHGAEHRIDPTRMYIMGHSAGAHLAALVATDGRRLAEAGKDLSIVKGVILLDSAAYDIPRYVNELEAPRLLKSLYKNAFGDDPAVWRDASPRAHVAPDKHIPPFLIFHTTERLAGKVLARDLAEALTAAGAPSRAVVTPGKNHASLNRNIGQPGDAVTAMILAFLGGKDPRCFPETTRGFTLESLVPENSGEDGPKRPETGEDAGAPIPRPAAEK